MTYNVTFSLTMEITADTSEQAKLDAWREFDFSLGEVDSWDRLLTIQVEEKTS